MSKPADSPLGVAPPPPGGGTSPLALREAQDPRTPPSRLAALASHDALDVQRSVAMNPNAPLATLEELWKVHPDGFANNPLVPLMLVADVRWLGRLSADALVAVLSDPELPAPLLSQIARHRALPVHRAVAGHPRTAPELLVRLARQYFLYEEVAQNPSTPRPYLDELAVHPWPSVRAALARNPVLSPELLEQLLADADISVQSAARQRRAHGPGAAAP